VYSLILARTIGGERVDSFILAKTMERKDLLYLYMKWVTAVPDTAFCGLQ
jgi:hypothetical protein